jgi:hypothetical protein
MPDYPLNFDDPVGRVVGRRTKVSGSLRASAEQQVDAAAWRDTFGGLRVPKGVYRFTSHEEADEWLWRMMARPKV